MTVSSLRDKLLQFVDSLSLPCVVIGPSHGGLVTIAAAQSYHPKIAAIILLAPALGFSAVLGRWYDLAAWKVSGCIDIEHKRFSGKTRLYWQYMADLQLYDTTNRIYPPTMLMHSRTDPMIPFIEANRFVSDQHAKGVNIELVALETGNHNLDDVLPAVEQHVVDFITNLLAMKIYLQVISAHIRLANYLSPTPLISFQIPGQKMQAQLKLENLQPTGSFKVRGAINKLLSLGQAELSKGVITASTGNHALATMHALTMLGASGTIYLPKKASRAKIQALKQYESKRRTISFFGEDSVETERHARQEAESSGKEYVSPYNDPMIIAGQGTIGIELIHQVDSFNNIFITVGGGGLLSGIASYLKMLRPTVKIYGCQPINSPVMYESVKAGKIINMESKDTLSDGSAGGIEEEAITYDLVRDLTDEYILLSEEEISQAIKLAYNSAQMVIEGAAGVALAGYLQVKDSVVGNSIIIICGGNISSSVFSKLLCK